MRYFFLTIFLLQTLGLWSDILPKDKSMVNYTSVYFEEEYIALAKEYLLVVDSDSTNFTLNNPSKKVSSALPAFRIDGLKWNTHYYWKIIAYDKNHRQLNTSKLHQFTILKQMAAFVDSILIDVKVNKNGKHAGGLICIDYTRSIYNRSGEAVWTLPFIQGCVDERTQIRDLKITQDNTITFLTDNFPLEIDFKGTILWKAPFPYVFEGDTIIYHHDFRKTPRGTYMVLGNKKINRRALGDLMKNVRLEPETEIIDSVLYKKTLMTVLLEFNAKGDLIWFWDANTYITDADLNQRRTQSGFPELTTHSNAFSENAKGDKVYVGFRDLSRIVKIDKKTKSVEMSYGSITQNSNEKTSARDLFKRQHDATITDRNTLLIFNNNNPGIGDLTTPYFSSVLELKEDAKDKDPPVIWNFDLNFDNLSDGKSMTGGNVVELPNSNLLICAGTLNRISEVTKGKEIVWDAFVLMKVKRAPRYRPFPQYRCNWAAQLTEPHFIPYLLSPSKTKGKEIKINVAIANTGNADDYYTITVFSGDSTIVHTKETNLITPNNSFELKFNLPVTDGKDNLRAEIKSKNSNIIKSLPLGNFKE